MKRGLLLTLILGIFLISFVSAQFLGRFNVGYFDESLILYGGLFVLFFALINFILGRTIFRENQATRVIISLVVSLFAVYGISTKNWGISTGNFYLGNFYFGDFWPSALTVLFIVGIIYFTVKWGLKYVLSAIGLLLILTSLTNLVYEKNIFLFLGIVLLVIGLLLQFRRPRIKGVQWQERASKIGRRIAKTRKPVFMRSPQERLERYEAKQAVRKERASALQTLKAQKAWRKEAKKRYIQRYGGAAWAKRKMRRI